MRRVVRKVFRFFYSRPIIAAGIIGLAPIISAIFVPYTRITADGFAHKFRLVAFHQAIMDGSIRPQWLQEVVLGYGAPVLLFIYPLPYYLTEIFYSTSQSVDMASRLFAVFTLVVGFVGMYLCTKSISNRLGGFAGALVYSWAAYRLLSTFVYEAWGEMLALTVLPFALLSLVLFSRKQTAGRALMVVLSLASLILSHNITAMIMFSWLLGAGVILIGPHVRRVVTLILLFTLSISVTAFFWIPAFFMKDLIRYPILVEMEKYVRWNFFKSAREMMDISLEAAKVGHADFYTFTPGIPIMASVCLAILVVMYKGFRALKNKKHTRVRLKSRHVLVLFCLAGVFGSCFLLSRRSIPLWDTGLLDYVVYPYRMLIPITFLGSILAGWVGSQTRVLALIISVSAVYFGLPFLNPYIGQQALSNSYYLGVQPFGFAPGTVVHMKNSEFVPRWTSTDFLLKEDERVLTRGESHPARVSLTKHVRWDLRKDESEHTSVEVVSERAHPITFNTLYFPNWRAYVDGKSVQTDIDSVGRIVVHAPAGKHTVDLRFQKSTIEIAADAYTLVGLALTGFTLWKLRVAHRRPEKKKISH